LAPGDMKKTGRVYLVSGGSEAIETALKLARQYHVETGHPGKSKVIARWQSYHGSTMGALSVTGNVARRELYAPMFASMPPIARDFIPEALERGRGYFEHGFTYSANPLSAAVGSAVLDYVRKNRLIARAARMGKVLGGKLLALRRHRIVGDVRGLGMMWGIEM